MINTMTILSGGQKVKKKKQKTRADLIMVKKKTFVFFYLQAKR